MVKVECRICKKILERTNKPNQGRNLGVSTRGFNALTYSKECARRYRGFNSFQRREIDKILKQDIKNFIKITTNEILPYPKG